MNLQSNSKTNYCAIYCRLSQEDDRTGTSGSIINQKEYLRDYVLNQGWQIYDIYTDDGVSGTTFERDGFKAMIEDIEKGKISTVVVKDLSRIGRNYLKTGYYTEEFFPKYNVRFIAVNDNVDTLRNADNELAPFKNIINEWYAKDISKKVTFSLTSKMKSLEETKTSTPIYGYKFTETGKRNVDEESASIVRYIFKEYVNGKSTLEIAQELTKKKIPIPGYYNYIKYNTNATKYSNYLEHQQYEWTRHLVYKIILKEEYIGTYIRGKRKTNFKTKKTNKVAEENRYKAKSKFEPIIDEELYHLAHQIKRRKTNNVNINIFSGLVYCKTCGNKLRISSSRADTRRLYCRNPIKETDGAIRYDDLEKIIQAELNTIFHLILSNEQKFMELALKIKNSKQDNNAKNIEIGIENIQSKIKDMDEKIFTLFDSYSKTEISNLIYQDLMKRYSADKSKLEINLKELLNKNNKIKIKSNQVSYVNLAELFINKVREYKNTNELTTELIIAFIEKIFISNDPKIKGVRARKAYIEIIYHDCDELIKEYLEDETNRSTLS